jgi:zinc protease
MQVRKGVAYMRLAVMLAILLLAACPGLAFTEKPSIDWPYPEEMEFPPLEFTSIEPVRHVLGNGLTVYLLADRDLPLLQGTVYIKAGSIYDSPQQTGLAELTARLTRAGGAGARTAAEVDEQLDFFAASVAVNEGTFYAMARFSSLSEYTAEVLDIVADILGAPVFAEDSLEVERNRMLEAIRRQYDDPMEVAVREFFKKIYGGHPAGAYPTVASVNAITRADLVDFHAAYYAPENATMAVSGDFDPEEMIALLEKTLGRWKVKGVEPPEFPPFDRQPERKVYYVERPLTQSVIFIGHPTVTLDNPDYPALGILSEIFGGALFDEIRVRRGLAYAAGGGLTDGYQIPGIFYAYAITRADATGRVLELMLAEMEKARQVEIPTGPANRARDAAVNRAVFRYTSAYEIASRNAADDLLGIEPGFFEEQLERIKVLTPGNLLFYAFDYLRPEEVVIVVVGYAPMFDRDLEDFGEVILVEPEQ